MICYSILIAIWTYQNTPFFKPRDFYELNLEGYFPPYLAKLGTTHLMAWVACGPWVSVDSVQQCLGHHVERGWVPALERAWAQKDFRATCPARGKTATCFLSSLLEEGGMGSPPRGG